MQNANQPHPPFSCTYSSQLPELLQALNCTIVISTYQAGKVIFISAKDQSKLTQLPRNFKKAMGIATKDDQMAVALKDEVLLLKNSKQLAQHYPKKPNVYDAMFMPRATYYTGALDIHDLDFGNDGLYAVNTSFSSIIKVDEQFSFSNYWKPPFISKLAHEDRFHLNGMAMQNGKPKYVTAFNQGDSPRSWKNVVTTDGILMDVDSNEIIAKNLPMPHSPRLINGELYILFSATGELAKIDAQTGKVEVLKNLNGFVRGMAHYGNYLFIGLSKLRENSSTFSKLAIAQKAKSAGVIVLHLPTNAVVGELRYQASVDEIYDIQILPQVGRGNILNTMTEDFKMGLMTEETTYWGRKKEDLKEKKDQSI